MKHVLIVLLCCLGITTPTYSQIEELHISKLEIARNKNEIFRSRDSVLILHIDTLIMANRAALQFYGKKKVTLHITHAELGKRVFFSGFADKNNASDFDINIRFDKLGSLYVMANGRDASVGTASYPHGDGGEVIVNYDATGIHPQQEHRRKPNYLHVDFSAGGRHINPTADVRNILSRIHTSGRGLRGVPSGQVYYGSPGSAGSFKVIPKNPRD